MPTPFDVDRIKSFHPFKHFFTRSLKDNDPTFLIRFPEIYMSPKELKAKKWAIDYYNKMASLPTIDMLRLEEEHFWAYEPIELDIPLSALYEKSFNRGKAFYARIELEKLQSGFDPHTLNPMPLGELAKVTRTILGTNLEPPVTFGKMARDRLYDVSVKEGLPFGLRFIDDATGGLQAADLGILAARPGTGKTLLFCHWALNWARTGKKIAIASCEMPANQIMYRLDGILGHFNPKLFRDSSAASKLKSIRPLVDIELELIEKAGGDIFFVPASQLNIDSMASFVMEVGADLLMVDGIYLLPSMGDKKESGWEAVKKNSNGLKQIAIAQNIPVIGTTQFNREGDIAYSDSILQDADIALGIVRNEDNNIQATIIKNRHGEGIGGGVFHDDWDTMGLTEVDAPPIIEGGVIRFGSKS